MYLLETSALHRQKNIYGSGSKYLDVISLLELLNWATLGSLED